jgi:hypothetical protein
MLERLVTALEHSKLYCCYTHYTDAKPLIDYAWHRYNQCPSESQNRRWNSGRRMAERMINIGWSESEIERLDDRSTQTTT